MTPRLQQDAAFVFMAWGWIMISIDDDSIWAVHSLILI